MLGNPGSYANKKRKKPALKQKKASEGNGVVKSNPSKRHRDRLNGELDRLTDLLPFSGEVRSRLDKLSVLRLSVGYLRVKSYFKATMSNGNSRSLMFSGLNGQNGTSVDTAGYSEGDLLLQALNGFAIVVTSQGSVFYASSTIKDYLGFHQSDVVHQSVFELIHTDDRALFRQQLHFALNPSPVGVDGDGLQSLGEPVMYNPEQLPPENSSFLERTFVCRFRCLLDNSSGFLALKFQGRLKYLHGQRVLNGNGNGNKTELGLFAIAMPVQPPTIVEIRAKMLLFQTKHKLDFTPMGVDSRGKIVLGYSETELCMRGSGYQFIHAADMMYCADKHIHMIKTGETGICVFRLLSKSRGWVWVKSNAKVIFKGGRPEFIVACQRALVNAEGEEYLRQRSLQLPFSCTTGEGLLYNTGAMVDIEQLQFNKLFNSMDDMKKGVTPGSMLDSFLSQDETAYVQNVDAPSPLDQVFMDSQALVTIGNDPWQNGGASATTSEPVVVKEEAKQSVMAVIDNLGKMAQDSDFCAALQNLDVSGAELMEWEHTIKRLSQDENQNSVRSELDTLLTHDIFDYIDGVLFKDKGEDLNAGAPSCSQPAPFTQLSGLTEPQLFPTPSPDHAFPPMNGVYAQQQHAMNGPVVVGQNLAQPAPMFTQKLFHPPVPPADADLPLQQLQLQDIFSPSIELPALTVPGASSIGHVGPQGLPGHMQPGQLLHCPQNNMPAASVAASGRLQHPNTGAPAIMDILPPLIPCSDFSSTNPPNILVEFATSCVQGSAASKTLNQQVQQWNQNQNQRFPPAGIMQNGHKLMPACQTPESQTLPCAGLWPRSVTELSHAQQGALSCGQAATQSSCMFNQHFSSAPAGGDVLALSGAPGLRGGDTALDQSPPQGSCYFQWSRSETVVGTSAINQENSSISPPNMASSELQQYLERYRHTQQDERVSAECNGIFTTPGHDVAMYLTE